MRKKAWNSRIAGSTGAYSDWLKHPINGRAWQVALFVGLVLWLGLMLRGLRPALQRRDDSRTLVLMFTGASAAIGLMYGAGFFFSARTHLSVMEYLCWWVVHLWVEGFFGVFATAALAFVFARLGLVSKSHAGTAVIASSALFLFAGIPGTFHHLYFSGTPTPILAIGATFSALEVVPLVLLGIEAFQTSRMQHAAPWMERDRWPVRFFVGVAFWNLVGAGLFGFLINPPIALYFMQGLNTTPVHALPALAPVPRRGRAPRQRPAVRCASAARRGGGSRPAKPLRGCGARGGG